MRCTLKPPEFFDECLALGMEVSAGGGAGAPPEMTCASAVTVPSAFFPPPFRILPGSYIVADAPGTLLVETVSHAGVFTLRAWFYVGLT